MSTTASIHGHEVIHLIHSTPTPFTRTTLADMVNRLFGPHARFHTCSAGDMTLDQLLQFLTVRGKVVEHDGRLYAVMANVCNHGDDEHPEH